MPTCSNCGRNFDDTFLGCPYCGTPKHYVSLDCPKCRRIDNVSKVSAIVQSETYQINGQVPVSYSYQDSDGWRHSITSRENYYATQQSGLASQLMWPEKPIEETGCSYGSIIILVGMVFCTITSAAVLAMSSLPKAMQLPALGLGVLVTFVILGLTVVGSWQLKDFIDKPYKTRYQVRMAAWEYSMSRWEALYYCSRDACLFLPGENIYANVSNLNDIIKWRPIRQRGFFGL